jgi:hypothetical protein
MSITVGAEGQPGQGKLDELGLRFRTGVNIIQPVLFSSTAPVHYLLAEQLFAGVSLQV